MLTLEELLFLEQGIYKAIEKDVSTKKSGNLRSKVNESYIEQYKTSGGKSYEARIGGNQVGTVSVTPAKETVKEEIVVEDSEKALKWAIENGFAIIDHKAVNRHFAETGEVGDGFYVDKWTYETEPKVTLRIDPEKVRDEIDGNLLQDTVAGLLGGDDGR